LKREIKRGEKMMYGEIEVTVLFCSLNFVKIKFEVNGKTTRKSVGYHTLKFIENETSD